MPEEGDSKEKRAWGCKQKRLSGEGAVVDGVDDSRGFGG